MTKSEFEKEISRIVNNTRLKCRVTKQDKLFLTEALKQTGRFATMGNDPTLWITVEKVAAGPRYVRMLVLRRRPDPTKRPSRQPCPKAKLVEAVYPTKTSRKKSENPLTKYKNHALKVREVFRSAVANQIKAFRSDLTYPRRCARTQIKLYDWMKIDIDHFNKPFIQLCDEFLKSSELHYSDIQIKGPPNMKELCDKALEYKWQEYHKTNAVLAAVDFKENRSAGSSNYIPDEKLLKPADKSTGLDLVGW